MERKVYENSFGTDRPFTNVLTTPYPLYVGTGNADRIKYQGSTAKYWSLRSPGLFSAFFVRRIGPDGGLSDTYARLYDNFVPALCVGR